MKQLLQCIVACWLIPAFAQTENMTDLDEVHSFVIDMQTRHGFTATELLHDFQRIHPLPAVIKAIQPPVNPGIRSWKSYRSRFVEPRRIAAGVDFWKLHRTVLERAEKQYGVPIEIIVGIIGVETIYGRNVGKFQTFAALSTLAFYYPPRATLFRNELEALLLLARDEGRAPLSYRGSYAGAMGLPQFLPSSVRHWAVDFDGDGRIDLANTTDAIGSVAHYLADHGWTKDAPIVAMAIVEGDKFNELLAEGIVPRRTPQEMEIFGVKAEGAPDQPVALIDLVTPGEPTEYRLGFHNFHVLTRYNQSSFYATAVNDLALAVQQALARQSAAMSDSIERVESGSRSMRPK